MPSLPRRTHRLTLWPALLVALILLGPGRAGRAATLTVTTTNDSGAGSLRQAIASAQSGDTIVFDPTAFATFQTITLGGTELALGQSLTITGPAAGVALDGGGASRVLEVSAGTATLTGLTLQNGSASGGGGVLVDSGATAALTACTLAQDTAANDGGGLANAGTVTLSGCTLTSDTATNGSGAGLLNSGTATLTGCVLSYDFALSGVGGGLDNTAGTATLTDCVFDNDYAGGGGGFSNSATATLTGCVLTNDTASNGNGGGGLNAGTATLTDCTLAGDNANYGGGLDNTGTVTLSGCTLTQNTANSTYIGGGLSNESAATATLTDDIFYSDTNGEIANAGSATASHCDIQETLGGTGDGVTDGGGNINADPTFVGAPADLHLQSGSPCAGAGIAVSGLTADLDGRARPGSPAAGAYEAAPTGAYALVVASLADGVPQSMRAAVTCANDYPNAALTFDPTAFAAFQTITLTEGELSVGQSLTITGPAAGVALDGGGASRILEVSAGTATLTGLTLQDGFVSGGSGGGVLVDSGATAALVGCTLLGNIADSGGGVYNTGTASLTGCTLTGNIAATGNGGGLNNPAGATLTLTDCTLTGNSAPNGSGGGLDDSAAVTLTGDILYGDSAGSSAEIGNSSYVTANHCDIAQSSGTFAGGGNINADPLLSVLGTYGGPTRTFALLPGSPCLGAGVAVGGVTADGRGVAVPQGGRYDIGAFESRGFTLAYGSGDGQSATVGTAFANPLVVTVVSAYSEPVAGGRVTFTAPTSGASASLTTSPAAIALGGAASVAATANGTVGGPYAVTPAAGGASGAVSFHLTNALVSTTLTVASSAPTSVYGQPVTFTATTTGLPNGASIAFADGAATLGTGTVSGGTATFTTTAALSVAGHTITATYTSNGTYAGASNTVTQTVAKAATTTALASSGSPSSVGQSVTFTATVSVTSPGAGTRTGTVTFTDTSTSPATTLGTGTLSGGAATFTTSGLSAGTHAVTASYGGDSDFTASATGTALTQTVNTVVTPPAGTTTTLASSLNPSTVGQSVTFTATVSGSGATGTVTFRDTSTSPVTTLGTGTLAAGTATFTTTTLSAGSHTLTATYGGNANFAGSASAALTQTVNSVVTPPVATTTTLAGSRNPSGAGQSVTFTATVSGAGGPPTGTVTFTDTSTSPATTLGTGTLSGGTATFTTSSLGAGTHTIVATYGGSGGFSASTSAALTQTVRAVLHTFPAGLQMIAVTESYGSAASAWNAPAGQNLYTWNGTAYSVTTSLPAPGQGAWVRLAQPASLYDAGTPASGPATLSLTQGWNLVGDPFGAAVPLSAMTASAGGTTYPLSGTQLLVYTTLYTYPAGASAYQAVGPTGSLTPFAGYWLYAFQPCTLTIPAP